MSNVLAYHKMLRNRLHSALSRELRPSIVSYFGFVRDLWQTVLGTPPDGFDRYDVELYEFRTRLGRTTSPPIRRSPLIVLQGQQLPVEFYELLRELDIPTTVLIDPTSPVSEQGATLAEIELALGVRAGAMASPGGTAPTPIQDFITRFAATDLGVDAEDEIPGRPILLRHEDVAAEACFAAAYARRYPREQTAVLVPSTDLFKEFHTALENSNTPVEWYRYGPRIPVPEQISFARPGLKLLTWASSAGLVFDRVILGGLHDAPAGRLRCDLPSLAATATKELVLSYSGRGEPVELTCLPRHLLDDRTGSGSAAAPPRATVSAETVPTSAHPAQDDLLRRHTTAVEAARRILEVDARFPSQHRRQVLSAEQEVGLACLMRGPDGDLARELPKGFRKTLASHDERAAAFDAMVLHNTGLVDTCTQKMQHGALDLEDLSQSGIFGLVRAVEKFDASRGFKFSTYATNWIRQGATRAVQDTGSAIRLPAHMWERIWKVDGIRSRLLSTAQSAEVADIARISGLEPSQVVDCLRLSSGVLSLDAPATRGSDAPLTEFLPASDREHDPDRVLDRRAVRDLLETAFSGMPERHAEVLRLRFGFGDADGMTLGDIGERYGVSRERIRQIEVKAKVELKRRLGELGLRDSNEVDDDTAPIATRARVRSPGGVQPRLRTADRKPGTELATGSGLIARFGSASVSTVQGIGRELADHAFAAKARTIVVRVVPSGSAAAVGVAHDGVPFGGTLLRSVLGSGVEQVDQRLRATFAAGLRHFDEVLVWDRTAGSGECLTLNHAPRTGAWWMHAKAERLPAAMLSERITDNRSAILFRGPRAGLGAENDDHGTTRLLDELGVRFGEPLREGLELKVNARSAVPRDPFLWSSPAAQTLPQEWVSGGGHRALVRLHVLPHPSRLRAEEAEAVGDPKFWAADQGFYIRCAGRYVSCAGWLGLPGLDSGPSTALARILVELEPEQAAAWGFAEPGPVAPPEALRTRLVALASRVRRSSANVLARRQENHS
ncbi:sigma-70 family RNA polymerase sigma factor [Saccharopolyspora gregorii]|uniref:sigma-70 family RNA polymerase sigma factor n=1 Tax=Saccharopolyspora gregorii TaxID=33914 RepID=UPI0031E7D829